MENKLDTPTSLRALCALVDTLADKLDIDLEESMITAITTHRTLRPVSMREVLDRILQVADSMDKGTPSTTEAADAARWRYTLENPFRALDLMRIHHSFGSPKWASEANAAVDAAIEEQQK